MFDIVPAAALSPATLEQATVLSSWGDGSNGTETSEYFQAMDDRSSYQEICVNHRFEALLRVPL